ncbi:hypothetical protein AVEN_14450-1 [Araneus ventricosus]|uniref:RAMA domain-containing protein n=1 Tax=Araneus ventricosus TaxID=182803 RepID=A0A4Y2SQL5_ARAVE|nr:hypothetical protein AVEN_14450-1 [Araneus ventricosus]
MPNEMNCCNINLNCSTPLKNPQGLQILNGNRPNEITIATTRLLSNDCVHHSLSQNISEFKGNCNTSYATIPTSDIMNSCNSNLNHVTPLKNLQDLHTLNRNKINKSIIATSQLSTGEIRSGFKSQRVMKRKTKVPLIELLQHNLLQPGENVLSVHTPEKIVFGSLDSNGKIISNAKIYSSPLQWYYDIPNFYKSAPKPSKSKPCYDKIYYQGRTLSHLVDIYNQGLENRNTSQGIEEPSVTLSSSTGLEVIQRSTAPQRVSAASTEAPISRPNVLNLLKMKLLLIEDNEVGHMSETVQWDDIDKWD